jgi:hypothetical protein
LINIVLWIAGIVVLAVAIWRVRGPFGRMLELDRLAENARRYDSWRGGSSRTAAGGPPIGDRTGADEMREMMRRQVMLWAGVGVVGVVLLVAGFAVR